MATDRPNAENRGARRLYLYYRVPAAELDAALQAAATMQQRLRTAHPGLRAELLCKCADDGATGEPAAHEPTLMEIYRREGSEEGAACGHGIDAALQAAIDSAAQQSLGGFVSGRRHVEVFVPFTPCAC